MKFTIEVPKITVDITWLEKHIQPFIQREALNTRTQIIGNLNAGKQADGSAMKRYSRGYALAKAASGRSGIQTDLNVTGELHRSFVTRNIPGGVELIFQGQHAPSRGFSEESKARLAAHYAKRRERGQVGQTAPAIRAKSTRSARLAKRIRGKFRAISRRVTGGGASMSNAALAESLYARGFTGWVSFSPQRLKEIEVNLGKEVDRILKSVIVVK